MEVIFPVIESRFCRLLDQLQSCTHVQYTQTDTNRLSSDTVATNTDCMIVAEMEQDMTGGKIVHCKYLPLPHTKPQKTFLRLCMGPREVLAVHDFSVQAFQSESFSLRKLQLMLQTSVVIFQTGTSGKRLYSSQIRFTATREYFSGFVNVSGFTNFRVFGFVGIY